LDLTRSAAFSLRGRCGSGNRSGRSADS